MLNPVAIAHSLPWQVHVLLLACFLSGVVGVYTFITPRRALLLRSLALYLFSLFLTSLGFLAVDIRAYNLQDPIFPYVLFILVGGYMFGRALGFGIYLLTLFLTSYFLFEPHFSLAVTDSVFYTALGGGIALLIGNVLKDYKDQLLHLTIKLDALAKRKDRVTNIIAHDMRNSLAIIEIQGELLRLEATDPKLAAEHINVESERLILTMDSILDIAKIEEAGTELLKEEFNLAELCNEKVLMFQRLHPHHWFTYSGEGSLVVANTRAIDRIIANLLSNAAKYSPPNTTIQLEVEINSNHFIIRVCDQGMGMTSEQMKVIFEPFVQGSQASRGVGLGLYIVKTLVELHGGSISVDSQLGEGTTFTVKIPLVPAIAVKKGFGHLDVKPATNGIL